MNSKALLQVDALSFLQEGPTYPSVVVLIGNDISMSGIIGSTSDSSLLMCTNVALKYLCISRITVGHPEIVAERVVVHNYDIHFCLAINLSCRLPVLTA